MKNYSATIYIAIIIVLIIVAVGLWRRSKKSAAAPPIINQPSTIVNPPIVAPQDVRS